MNIGGWNWLNYTSIDVNIDFPKVISYGMILKISKNGYDNPFDNTSDLCRPNHNEWKSPLNVGMDTLTSAYAMNT